MQHLPVHLVGFSAFVFGLIIGSFLNVVIHRLPREQSIVFPGSRCPGCNTPIKPYDNIPVVSYAILRGRCRACGAHISLVYPVVELLVGLVYLALFIRNGLSANFFAEVVFVSLIIPLVFIDIAHKILPNRITYPGLVILLVVRLLAPDKAILDSMRRLFGMVDWPDYAVALVGAALGALAGGGILWLVREVYYLLRRVEGMGLGDVKMMLMVGAFLGWQLSVLIIVIASFLGSIVGILVIALGGGSRKTEIPFGAFLGPGAIIALFAGRELIDWYMRLYR